MTLAGGAWRPLLEGAARRAALDRVREIAEALEREIDRGHGFPGLAGGLGGLAVFYQYCDAALGEARHGERAADLLDACAASAAGSELHVGLFGGHAGIGWLLEHVGACDGEDDPCRPIDALLLDALARPWTGGHDLVNGLVGIGVYALERGDRGAGPLLLERVLDLLASSARTGPDGATWHTPAAELVDWQRRAYPDGYYNLGVAHGVPGILGLLARAVAAGHERRRGLLEEGLAWLAAQAQRGGDACYGACRTDAAQEPPTRSAWCYGDPGVAAVLAGAGARTGERRWIDLGAELAAGVARRPVERAGCRDAGLCHGTAGLAHILNRLHQATGDPDVAAAARRWFELTLSRRDPGGVAGFGEAPPEAGELEWEESAGLLTGAAGVGLALLAASTDLPPDWDRLLLLDVAPGDERLA
ncbi:MAG TPA: lanthionine synthetase C family protein [Kofleriaceae bacterium]|nr:lanthionine synthetase C family protein [Kofleriaceae bacterium]